MALIKNIELENGIIVNYHRIISIRNVINSETIIEIGSYTNKAKREEEKSKLSKKEPMNVFIEASCIVMPYEEKTDVTEAYKYLKNLDIFKGAGDDV